LSLADSPYPALTLSISGDFGVVEAFFAEEDDRLLRGDGSVPSGDVMKFPILGEEAVFTGDFISSRTRACDVLSSFVSGTSPAALGDWERL